VESAPRRWSARLETRGHRSSNNLQGCASAAHSRRATAWSLRVCAVLALAAFCVALGAPPATARYIAPATLGQHLMFNSALDPDVPVHAMRLWDSNTSWCKMDTGASSGQYRFGQLEALLGQASRQGADVEFTFGRTPRWAVGGSDPPSTVTDQCASTGTTTSADPPASRETWRNYVTAVVTRARGRIRAYELWNEFNNPDFWAGSVDQMVQMSIDAAAIIHAVDPSALVLSPSASATPQGTAVLREYLSRLPAGTIDAIAVHTYTKGRWPEATVPAAMADVKAALPAAYADMPVWSTEGGWGTNQAFRPLSQPASAASDQRAFVARYQLMLLTQGFTRSYWYAYQNTDWGTLFDGTSLTPAGVATRTLDDWLVRATLSGCTSPDGNLWTCEMTSRSGVPQRIVWATQWAVWYPTSGYDQVGTLDGGSSAASGWVQVKGEPLLLSAEGGPVDAPAPPAAAGQAAASRQPPVGQPPATPQPVAPQPAAATQAAVPRIAKRITLTRSSAVFDLTCRGPLPCAGRVTLLAQARAKRGARTPVLARSKRVDIEAGQSERVTVGLTGAGRRLVRRNGRIRATVRITSIDALGQAKNTSVNMTLRARGRH
jgi:hypothetical protein